LGESSGDAFFLLFLETFVWRKLKLMLFRTTLVEKLTPFNTPLANSPNLFLKRSLEPCTHEDESTPKP
jgi:hypothetical protein